jgi:hypothetical protein
MEELNKPVNKGMSFRTFSVVVKGEEFALWLRPGYQLGLLEKKCLTLRTTNQRKEEKRILSRIFSSKAGPEANYSKVYPGRGGQKRHRGEDTKQAMGQEELPVTPGLGDFPTLLSSFSGNPADKKKPYLRLEAPAPEAISPHPEGLGAATASPSVWSTFRDKVLNSVVVGRRGLARSLDKELEAAEETMPVQPPLSPVDMPSPSAGRVVAEGEVGADEVSSPRGDVINGEVDSSNGRDSLPESGQGGCGRMSPATKAWSRRLKAQRNVPSKPVQSKSKPPRKIAPLPFVSRSNSAPVLSGRTNLIPPGGRRAGSSGDGGSGVNMKWEDMSESQKDEIRRNAIKQALEGVGKSRGVTENYKSTMPQNDFQIRQSTYLGEKDPETLKPGDLGRGAFLRCPEGRPLKMGDFIRYYGSSCKPFGEVAVCQKPECTKSDEEYRMMNESGDPVHWPCVECANQVVITVDGKDFIIDGMNDWSVMANHNSVDPDMALAWYVSSPYNLPVAILFCIKEQPGDGVFYEKTWDFFQSV